MKPVFSKRTRPLAILCALIATTSLTLLASIAPSRAVVSVSLGSAENFSVLSAFGIFAAGAPIGSIKAVGNYGSYPTATITNPQAFQVANNSTNHGGDSVSQTAHADLLTAFSAISNEPTTGTIPLQLGGVTITPGVYKASVSQPFYSLNGVLTFDAQNDSTSIFIVKGTRLTTAASASSFALINGARVCNIYWFMETVAVAAQVNLGDNTNFQGTIVTDRNIAVGKNVTVEGRLLTTAGEVFLQENDYINLPTRSECPKKQPSPTPTPSPSASNTSTPTTTPTSSVAPTSTSTSSSCGAGVCPSPTTSASSCGVNGCPSPTPTDVATTKSSPSPTQSASPSVSSSPTSSSSSTPTSNTTPKPSPSPTEKPTPTFSPSPTTSPTTAVLTSPTPTPTETQQVPIKPIGFVATDTNYKMLANLKSPNENYYQNFTTLNKSAPVTISIPAIKVNSKIIGLGFDAEGGMEVPNSGKIAGYFTGAPTPGELGPAIIVGHVDWQGKIGIFYNLKKLKSGDKVIIKRQDGKIVNFKVTKVMTVPKLEFPTDLVYGNLNYPGLRLITCGGKFDAKLKRHVDNIIVFAQVF